MGNTPNIDSNTIAKSAIEQANINSSEYRDNPNWVNDYTRLNAENVNNMRKNIYKYVKELTTQALVQENNVVKDLIEDTVGEKYPDNNSTGEIFNDYSERIVYENGSKLGNIASGDYSSARGRGTTASGKNSSAEGVETEASGHTSHAQGNNTKSLGTNNHSQGRGTVANGGYGTHAQGVNTTAMGDRAPHAQGYSTNSLYKLHPEWTWDIKKGTVPTTEDILREWEQNKFLLARGETSHSEGEDTISLGNVTHSEGKQTIAIVPYSHTEGYHTLTSKDTETSNNLVYASHSEGYNTTTDGSGAHSQGYNTTSIGKGAHSQGVSSVTAKNAGVDFKNDTKNTIKSKWSGISSYNHRFLLSRGIGAHAQGYNSLALENYSASFGKATIAMGEASEAHGNQTQALHECSFAAGLTTITTGPNQFVVGKRNAKNTSSDALFVVGNGTNGSNHKNALEVMSDGSANLQTQGTTNNSIVIKKTLDDEIKDIRNNISNALHFRGVYTELPDPDDNEFNNGDVIIISNGSDENPDGNEYVYSKQNEDELGEWVELGNANDFLLKTDAERIYATKSYVANSYLTKTDAGNTYLSKSNAERDYQLKSDMVNMPDPWSGNIETTDYNNKYLNASSVIEGINAYCVGWTNVIDTIDPDNLRTNEVAGTSAVVKYVNSKITNIDFSAGNIDIGSSGVDNMSLTARGNVLIEQNLTVDGELIGLDDLILQKGLISYGPVKASEYLIDDGNGNYVALDTGLVDSSLSTTSINAVQNKVVTNKLNDIDTVIGTRTNNELDATLWSAIDNNYHGVTEAHLRIGNLVTQLDGKMDKFGTYENNILEFTNPSTISNVVIDQEDSTSAVNLGYLQNNYMPTNIIEQNYSDTESLRNTIIPNAINDYITTGTDEPNSNTPGKIYIQIYN